MLFSFQQDAPKPVSSFLGNHKLTTQFLFQIEDTGPKRTLFSKI